MIGSQHRSRRIQPVRKPRPRKSIDRLLESNSRASQLSSHISTESITSGMTNEANDQEEAMNHTTATSQVENSNDNLDNKEHDERTTTKSSDATTQVNETSKMNGHTSDGSNGDSHDSSSTKHDHQMNGVNGISHGITQPIFSPPPKYLNPNGTRQTGDLAVTTIATNGHHHPPLHPSSHSHTSFAAAPPSPSNSIRQGGLFISPPPAVKTSNHTKSISAPPMSPSIPIARQLNLSPTSPAPRSPFTWQNALQLSPKTPTNLPTQHRSPLLSFLPGAADVAAANLSLLKSSVLYATLRTNISISRSASRANSAATSAAGSPRAGTPSMSPFPISTTSSMIMAFPLTSVLPPPAIHANSTTSAMTSTSHASHQPASATAVEEAIVTASTSSAYQSPPRVRLNDDSPNPLTDTTSSHSINHPITALNLLAEQFDSPSPVVPTRSYGGHDSLADLLGSDEPPIQPTPPQPLTLSDESLHIPDHEHDLIRNLTHEINSIDLTPISDQAVHSLTHHDVTGEQELVGSDSLLTALIPSQTTVVIVGAVALWWYSDYLEEKIRQYFRR